jgi:hypothetical protein
MPTPSLNSLKDNLFQLIKSLTASEKRNFSLYANRLEVNIDSKFLSLFAIIDKMENYDENVIIKNNITTKKQLSNLKAQLYRQILVSLRMNPLNQDNRYVIREQLDFATILHKKGLFKQSLKVLDKVKKFAIDREEKDIVYEIIELEKTIESQYTVKDNEERIDFLISQSEDIFKSNHKASMLSNLYLKIYSIAIKIGYVKNVHEKKELEIFFISKLPKYEFKQLGVREKLLLYNAHLMYNFVVQDYISCYRYSSKCINLFYENEQVIHTNPVWFLKLSSYVLESLFIIKHKKYFSNALTRLEETVSNPNFPKNDNTNSIYFFCIYNSRFNEIFLDYDLKKGLDLINEFLIVLKKHKDFLDEHRIMVFYYKIASIYFLNENYKKCIEFVNRIIENKSLVMREDLLCFSRILSLMAHYEAGIDSNLDKQIVSTYQFLIKLNGLNKVQIELIKSLKRIANINPTNLKSELIKLHSNLKKYENHRYERRIFLHLDLISWLESKIENKKVSTILIEKNNRKDNLVTQN